MSTVENKGHGASIYDAFGGPLKPPVMVSFRGKALPVDEALRELVFAHDRVWLARCQDWQTELPDELLRHPVKYALGHHAKDMRWETRNAPLGELIPLAEKRRVGLKDGTGITQGALVSGQRLAKNVEANYLLMIDDDTGSTPDEVVSKIVAADLFAIVWTTHSHGAATTAIQEDKFIRWCKGRGEEVGKGDDLVRQTRAYLETEKRYKLRVLDTIQGVQRKLIENGMHFIVSHAPMNRLRILMVLKSPFDFANRGSSQTAAIDEWKSLYKAVSEMLGVTYDPSCIDPSRLMYLPAKAEGEGLLPHAFVVLNGDLLDLDAVEVVSEPVGAKTKAKTQAQSQVSRRNTELATPGLAAFVKAHGKSFRAADCMQHFDPDGLRHEYEDKLDFRCPNEDGHSEVKADDRAFMVKNGDGEQGFAMFCHHATCKHESSDDRAWYLDQFCKRVGVQHADELLTWCPGAERKEPEETPTGDEEVVRQIEGLTRDSHGLAKDEVMRVILRLPDNGRRDDLIEKYRTQIGTTKKALEQKIKRITKELRGDGDNSLPDRAQYAELDARLALYNERFALIRIGAGAHVMKMPDAPNEPCEPMAIPTFKLMQGIDKVTVGDGDTTEVAHAWLDWKYRKTFENVVFKPVPVSVKISEAVSEKRRTAGIDYPALNLWRGFAVEGKPGDWSKLREHLYKVVCRRNPVWFAWVMTWLADIVQDPANKKGSAVIVKGIKGTGKTKVAEWIAKLAPRNSFAISKESQVLGRFNAHHAEAIFICMEEPFWAGDKAAEGVLKDMITGRTHVIEKKFVDPYQLDSCVRLWLCSNHDWVVPATGDERRFMVLTTDNSHEKDETWFASIDQQMENGGLEAMMFDLSALKTPGFVSLRMPPKTPWLVEQVERSLPIEAAWLYSVLTDGYLTDSQRTERDTPYDLVGEFHQRGRAEIPAAVVQRHFHEFARSVGRRAIDDRQLGAFLAELGVRKPRRRGNGERPYVYVFPELDEVQAAFEKKVGVKFDGAADLEAAVLASYGTEDMSPDVQAVWRAYGEGGALP